MHTTPKPRSRGAVPAVAALAAAVALLAIAVAPAAAKESLQARLEAPISFQSPPGSVLLVAVIVTVPDGPQQHPVDGSPIWLRLIGPNGDATEAPGRMGTGAGRYEMRITVPPGGPRRLDVFMKGSSDMPILLEGDPFTFRPIGAGTAQLAAPLAVSTPAVRASAPATQPRPPAEPAASATPSSDLQPWLAAVGAIAALVVLAIAGVAVAGRARSHRRPGATPIAGPSDAPTTITGS